jgi:hypothetical protein
MLMQRLADGDRFAHPAHHIRIDIHALDRPEQAVFAVQNASGILTLYSDLWWTLRNKVGDMEE